MFVRPIRLCAHPRTCRRQTYQMLGFPVRRAEQQLSTWSRNLSCATRPPSHNLDCRKVVVSTVSSTGRFRSTWQQRELFISTASCQAISTRHRYCISPIHKRPFSTEMTSHNPLFHKLTFPSGREATIPTGLFIDNKFVASESQKTFQLSTPLSISSMYR